MKTDLPFQEVIYENISERTFNQDVSEEELVWHRDLEDRTVVVVEDTDWKIQYENQLPMEFNKSIQYFIPKEMYHRVVKGSGDLKVIIVKHGVKK
jgi:hypothetical protein